MKVIVDEMYNHAIAALILKLHICTNYEVI